MIIFVLKRNEHSVKNQIINREKKKSWAWPQAYIWSIYHNRKPPYGNPLIYIMLHSLKCLILREARSRGKSAMLDRETQMLFRVQTEKMTWSMLPWAFQLLLHVLLGSERANLLSFFSLQLKVIFEKSAQQEAAKRKNISTGNFMVDPPALTLSKNTSMSYFLQRCHVLGVMKCPASEDW